MAAACLTMLCRTHFHYAASAHRWPGSEVRALCRRWSFDSARSYIRYLATRTEFVVFKKAAKCKLPRIPAESPFLRPHAPPSGPPDGLLLKQMPPQDGDLLFRRVVLAMLLHAFAPLSKWGNAFSNLQAPRMVALTGAAGDPQRREDSDQPTK